MQSLLRALYPSQCVSCGDLVDEPGGLCGACFAKTPFINGLVCDGCGVPLPGETSGKAELCDDCLTIARPWDQGRAVMLYQGNGRRLVLAFKHGDRPEMAKSMAPWLARAGAPLLRQATVIAPIPLHWRRLIKRRFNQAAELSNWVARAQGITHVPDLLRRSRATRSQDGRGRDERFANVSQAITVHPNRVRLIKGQSVCLVDDVMTSGATFAAAADACLAAGAASVTVLALARVTKGD